MKIKEHDFKNIPEKKEFIAVLKKLNSLPEGGNPHPYFEKLMLILSELMAQDVVPTIYPYLVGMAVERTDFSYFNFIINLKNGFYMRGDLTELSEGQIREYLAGMFQLHIRIGLSPSEAALNMEESFKSIYLWNAMMLYSNSPDVLVLVRQGRFEKPFKVKCPHCENDVHSLCINVDHMEHTSHITPKGEEGLLDEILFYDDVYSVFMKIFRSFEENHFTRVLPYVYGTYECSKCHETSIVMDAMKMYQFQEDPPFLPSDDFLKKMEFFIYADPLMEAAEQWMLTQFIVSGHRANEGNLSLKALNSLLFICDMKPKMLGVEGEVLVLKEIEKILSANRKKSTLRGQVLTRYVSLLQRQEGDEGKNTKIWNAHQEIIALYMEFYGEGHEKTQLAIMEQKLYEAKMNSKEEVSILTEFYDKFQENKQDKAMEELESQIAQCLIERQQFQEAIVWKEKELKRKAEEYGEKSFDYGIYVGDLAQVYVKAEEFKKGEELFGNSLELLLSQFIHDHQLTDTFLENKRKKKVTEMDDLYQEAHVISQTYVFLGELYFKTKEFEKSLECHEKASKLWDWVTEFNGVESATYLLNQGMALNELGDKKKAKVLAEKAVKIFEIRVKNEQNETVRQLAENGRNRGKTFLEQLK